MPTDRTQSDVIEIAVPPECDGERADKAVVRALGTGAGRAKAKQWFDKGLVRIEGHVVRKGTVVRAGQIITVPADVKQSQAAVPEADAALCVVLERDDVVVVRKPSGQPTAPVRAGETGTLVNALLARYPEMQGFGHSEREPGIVHRLDSDTSGLVVAARTQAAFDELTAALRSEQLHKSYLLLCAAEGLAPTGTISIPLAPHPKDRKRVLACVHPRDVARNRPRPATTSYTVVQQLGAYALVEASASKASRHQIRAHFAAIGHPLLGDALYGGELELMQRQALHAHRIVWPGSAVVAAFEVRDELPQDMQRVVEALAHQEPTNGTSG